MKDFGKMDINRDQVNIFHQIPNVFTTVIGQTENLVVKANAYGQMVTDIMDKSKTVCNMEMEYIIGKKDKTTQDIGKMENRMKKVPILIQKENVGMVYGKTVKE